MTRSLKKGPISLKVIFKNWSHLSEKRLYEEFLTRRPTFIEKMFLKLLIFKILYFLKLCPIFVGSVHNFSKSNDDKI